jgi:hypothetical protein
MRLRHNRIGELLTQDPMATFNRAQIPDSIVTMEALMIWASEILTFMNPSDTIIVAAGESDLSYNKTAARLYPLQTTNPNRYVCGAYVPLALDSGVGAIWASARESATGAIPTQFRKSGT